MLNAVEPRHPIATPSGASRDDELPSHVRYVSCLDGLARPLGEGINLVVWGREMPCFRAEEIQELIETGFDVIRITTDPGRIAADIHERLPPSAAAAWLPADAAALAVALASHAGVRRISARLEIVDGDSCRFFHADSMRVRLLTTYAGRGTQWLSDDDARNVSAGTTVAPELVREIETGSVALFRGGASGGVPLMHRSPPRGAGDPARLVLAMDPFETRS